MCTLYRQHIEEDPSNFKPGKCRLQAPVSSFHSKEPSSASDAVSRFPLLDPWDLLPLSIKTAHSKLMKTRWFLVSGAYTLMKTQLWILRYISFLFRRQLHCAAYLKIPTGQISFRLKEMQLWVRRGFLWVKKKESIRRRRPLSLICCLLSNDHIHIKSHSCILYWACCINCHLCV